jgi:predicted GTPase
MRKKVIIMGAAGRDFHNFNVYFRNNRRYEVVAFTAAQIPGIQCRVYPPELAGADYPNGIPVYPEEELPGLIKEFDVDEVVFAYSDVSYEYVMHKASLVLANGADFCLMGPKKTMLKAKVQSYPCALFEQALGKAKPRGKSPKFLKTGD